MAATLHINTTRRMRAFKRWMRSQGIEWSDALQFVDHGEQEGISVVTICDLLDGDLVATIPKRSCLTIKNSGARVMIEDAGLDGYLGLAAAIMYEKSLGQSSPWFGYLQLLPESESVPLLWSIEEIDSLLCGTEIHKIVREDKIIINEDWKECILPLTSSSSGLNPDFFGVERYFAAKSLISSRSFEIDDYHGFGMVPLADLFNHKTGAEDVHFTSISSSFESDNDADESYFNGNCGSGGDSEPPTPSIFPETSFSSQTSTDHSVLEMIIVKNVKAQAQVFNTYGSLGNAALLHRYGFTEPDNPYDIVNLDLALVLEWSSSLFSDRYIRRRLSLWRKLDYSGCDSQNIEYFEISFDGEPQVELLVLFYVMLLTEKAYDDLDVAVSTPETFNKYTSDILSGRGEVVLRKGLEVNKCLLLTKSVCQALLSVADIRERLYGSRSLEDDIEELKKCCHIRERKLFHSLTLRVSERRILEKLRSYSAASGSLRPKNSASIPKTRKT